MQAATDYPENIRFYDFEGGFNFRDLGGYATEDGRTVRYGQMFRTGVMHRLTPADIAQIKALGIRSVCDFRSRTEREDKPSHWLADQDIDLSVRDDTDQLGNLGGFYQSIIDAPHTARDVMLSGYRTIAYTLAESYRAMFERLVAGNAPLIFHCAGGKDRTGIAAGLLLTALGVPRDLVLRDYQTTDRMIPHMYDLMRSQVEAHVKIEHDPSIWMPLMVSHPSYLEATFEEMTRRDGSVEAFLERHAGVDDKAVGILRNRYTE